MLPPRVQIYSQILLLLFFFFFLIKSLFFTGYLKFPNKFQAVVKINLF